MAGSATTASIFLVGNQSETGVHSRCHPLSSLVHFSWLGKNEAQETKKKGHYRDEELLFF